MNATMNPTFCQSHSYRKHKQKLPVVTQTLYKVINFILFSLLSPSEF